jgi:cytochrome c oxidase subunit 2
MSGLRLTLPEASANARQVDTAFFSILGISGAIFLLLLVLLIVFAARYRRGSPAKRGPLPAALRREFEIGWTVATTFLAIFIFWWFVGGSAVPTRGGVGPMEVHVVAKQWMWKTQQPNGAREIDALHVPVDTPVRLVMTSQDVIHSFYVPAFRLKQDVLPSRVTELNFTPTEIGAFDLFCAEYCGTQHSHMIGQVTVMARKDYAAWLDVQPHEDTLARDGETLFATMGCGGCHAPESRVKAPKLEGLYGATVALEDGRRVTADDDYIRNAILRPRDAIVAGYRPIMPSYAGIASTTDVEALLAYIKSLPRAEAKP